MRYLLTLLALISTLSASAQIVINLGGRHTRHRTHRERILQDSIPQDSIRIDSIRVDSTRIDSIPQITEPVVIPRKPIKEHLLTPVQLDSITTINETVYITEQGDAAPIIEKNLKAEPKAVNGYRIIIFMSNTQSARRDAVAVQENFSLLFPQEQSYLIYENPYFKVAVGNCTSSDEAIILLGGIRKHFPKAFIVRENINIEEFAKKITVKKQEEVEVPTTSTEITTEVVEKPQPTPVVPLL